MESLLYVVLYCSFLWLPHNLSKADLASTIQGLFEESSWVYGTLTGGGGKIANAMLRLYTGRVEFNEPLKEWLTTVMDYLSPAKTPHSYAGVGHKWSSPEPLNQFWTDFLQTRTLPQNDRVVHEHPYATGKEEPLGSDASTEAISLGKRPSEERDDDLDGSENMPTPKKPRAHMPVASPPPQGLRRSQRARVPRHPAPAAPSEQRKQSVPKKQPASRKQPVSRKQPTPRRQPPSRKQAEPPKQPARRKSHTQTKTSGRHVRR